MSYPAEGTASHPSEYQAARLPETAMRFLCVCEGGNCRSTSLAMLLKATLKYDAIACSWKDIAPVTLAMLCAWADVICVLEAYMAEKIPAESQYKVNVLEVGPDHWCNPFHQELVGKLRGLLATTKMRGRKR